MKHHLWWIILAAFWVAYAAICLTLGEYLYAVLGVGSLASVLIYARNYTVQADRISILKATIASLEQALKEAHRRDLR